MVKLSIFVIAILLTTVLSLPPQNPIIGVYTEDAEDFGQKPSPSQTYISASYIKNL
jgi:hypothetical protein